MREAINDKNRLVHILESINRIQEFTKDQTEESLNQKYITE